MASQGLAVYDLKKSAVIHAVNAVGGGVHHSGVVYRCLPTHCNEVSYGMSGISFVAHATAPHHYQNTIGLEGPAISQADLMFILAFLRDRCGWTKNAYSIPEGRCCVTFSRLLTKMCGLRGFPDFADRGARWLGWVPFASASGAASNSGGHCDSSSDEEEWPDLVTQTTVEVYVQVPPGVRPGMEVAFQVPGNGASTVKVPFGMQPGMIFCTQVEKQSGLKRPMLATPEMMPAAKRRRNEFDGEHRKFGIIATRPDIIDAVCRFAQMRDQSGQLRGFAREGRPCQQPQDRCSPVSSQLIQEMFPKDELTLRQAKIVMKHCKQMCGYA